MTGRRPEPQKAKYLLTAVLATGLVFTFALPASAGEWSTSVTVTVGGAAVIGGVYMIWNASVTKRVEMEREDSFVAAAEVDGGDDNEYKKSSGEPSGPSPDVHVNLVSISF